ncbi:MAG: putative dehydrogenase [Saprospiraceae bacterium]|jgi:predicted dehydrogenase
MTIRKFRWGIIGAGKIAGHFANDLALLPHAELYAVASRSQKRAETFADKHGSKHALGSYEEMVTAGVDAVYIATRHPQHCAPTIMCLNAEIPVLCEKPLAMNSDEVAKMIQAAKKNDTFLMEAIWTRFLPSFRKAIELIEAGEIGEVLTVKADFGFHSPVNPNSRLYNREMGGGVLLDIGIYPILLAQILFGQHEKIQATAHIGTTGVDEETAINLSYPNGEFALLHATVRNKTESVAFIHGTRGTMKLATRWHESNSFSIEFNDGETRTYEFDFKSAKGYKFEIEHVMSCIQKGKNESPLLPFSFSENLMRTLDEVRGEIGLSYE